MRSLAAAAGVTPMTVSLALRGHPRVSAATRMRIQQLAEAAGYRPDPVLTHLMQHLRAGRTSRSGANLAVLATLDAPFARRLIAGAQARAARLGHGLDRIDPRVYQKKPAALTRALNSRGIAGILLAPAASPTDYRELLDWRQFAAVAMTYSVFEPRVHRVVTHHFDNAVRTFALLRRRDFKRIGFALTSDMEFRANHSYSGAYFRSGDAEGVELLPLLLIDRTSRRGVRDWFEQHRPEAVVVANSHQAADHIVPALGVRGCQDIAFASLDCEEKYGLAGIDQLFETIGSQAIDALVAQIHRNERGLPEHPTIGMVEGQWVEARGLYPFRAAALRADAV